MVRGNTQIQPGFELICLKEFVLMSLRSIEVSLYKIGLSKSPSLAAFSNQDFSRLNYLYACVEAIKSFFDTFLTIPISRFHCIPLHTCMQLTWGMGILQLLTTFEHPDWDLAWVRETISFVGMLHRLAGRYEKAKEELGIDPHTPQGDDIFSQSTHKFRVLAETFENLAKLARDTPRTEPQVPPTMTDFAISGDGMDLLDDTWMRDFMGPWDS
jgi:hypothetical protein